MNLIHSPTAWLACHCLLAFALVTPLGALLFSVGADHLAHSHPSWEGVALAFCAGTFLCIACADWLSELQFHSHDRVKLSLALLAGIAVALLIARFGHATHDHPHNESLSQLRVLTSGSNPPATTQFVPEANLALSKAHRLQCPPLWTC